MQIEKSIDGVLGIRTQGCRMVGPDETMELWQPPRVGPIYYLLRRSWRRPSHYFKWWPLRQWTLLPLPMFVNKVKHLLNWSPTFRPPYLVDSVTWSFLWKNIYSLWPLPTASNENFDALWWLFLPETAIFTVALQAACPYWAILGEFWATIFYESTPIFLKLPF